jgi:3-phosphoshikimate 1-carboxyvinyltransferase
VHWTIHPGALRSGTLNVPGDKSITHRAVLFGMLAEGETVIRGANPGEDTRASAAAAAALGATVRLEDSEWRVLGTGGRLRESGSVIDCGNSGTSLRLLAGAVAGHPLLTVLTGDDSLRRRPVDRVIAPLRRMGADLRARDGDRLPPLVVRGAALTGARFETVTRSAQVASAILLAGLAARGVTTVATAAGVRDHTERMFGAFGLEVGSRTTESGARELSVEGPAVPRGIALRVPGDPSAAAFFFAIAAATPGMSVRVTGVSVNPTRLGFLDSLRDMGAGVQIESHGIEAGEPVGEIRVTGPERLDAADVPQERVPSMVDEIPAWAVAASLAHGTSRLGGASELRLKESDRLRVVADNLRALGVGVEETADGLAIIGGAPGGGTVRSHSDHRVAMAFAVLGSRAMGPIEIDDARHVATSFPGFADAYRALGGQLNERENDAA